MTPADEQTTFEQQLLIEPLDPRKHDRSSFSCGIPRLDNFLKRTAKKQQAGNFTRVWVAIWPGPQEIAGYYAMNAHKLEVGKIPPGMARNAPSHGDIPAVYLSMIAVDRRHQGKGLGKILLAHALARAAGVAKQIGLKAVVLDVIKDGGPESVEKRFRFYRNMGFESLPSQPHRMLISIESIP